MNILSNLDLNLNQILNVVVQNLTTEPSDPQIGQIYYNTQKKRMFYYNGSMWEAMDAKDSSPTAESIVRTINGGKEKIESSKVKTLDDKLNRADLINSINEADGKIKSEKIEDLDKSITAESIVSKINSGNTKISQGLIDGLTEKLGGLETIANADLKKQDAISQASKYTDKKIKDLIGSAPQELDTLEEISKKLKEDENLRNVLTEGLSKKTGKFVKDIGDGNNTVISLNHGLKTSDVAVTLRENASPFRVVYTDVEITDENTVTLKFAKAPKLNEYRVIVIG